MLTMADGERGDGLLKKVSGSIVAQGSKKEQKNGYNRAEERNERKGGRKERYQDICIFL